MFGGQVERRPWRHFVLHRNRRGGRRRARAPEQIAAEHTVVKHAVPRPAVHEVPGRESRRPFCRIRDHRRHGLGLGALLERAQRREMIRASIRCAGVGALDQVCNRTRHRIRHLADRRATPVHGDVHLAGVEHAVRRHVGRAGHRGSGDSGRRRQRRLRLHAAIEHHPAEDALIAVHRPLRLELVVEALGLVGERVDPIQAEHAREIRISGRGQRIAYHVVAPGRSVVRIVRRKARKELAARAECLFE